MPIADEILCEDTIQKENHVEVFFPEVNDRINAFENFPKKVGNKSTVSTPFKMLPQSRKSQIMTHAFQNGTSFIG